MDFPLSTFTEFTTSFEEARYCVPRHDFPSTRMGPPAAAAPAKRGCPPTVHPAWAYNLGVQIRNLFLAAALASCAGIAGEKEVKVKMKDLPAAVRKTVQEQLRDASLRGLSREVEDGKIFYEASLNVGGHAKDVLVDESGAVVAVEEQVPMSSLPPAAREALQKQFAGGKLVTVESITRNNTVAAYEAHVRKGKQTIEIKVTPNGKPVDQ